MLPTIVTPVQGVYSGFRSDRVFALDAVRKGVMDPEVLAIEALNDRCEERQLKSRRRERRAEDR